MAPSGPRPQQHTNFLDAVLDTVCCSSASAAETDCDEFICDKQPQWGEKPRSNRQRGGQQTPPLLSSDRRQRRRSSSLRRSKSTGSLSKLNKDQRDDDNSRSSSQDRNNKRRQPGSVILPHLRFNPLPQLSQPASVTPKSASTSISTSSLQDFFTLFLADDAPHSFKLFHEKNGDENVKITQWKEDTNDNYRIERTVVFCTKITPGSSSNPLSQSEHVNNSSGSNSTTNVIPLKVTIRQSLIGHTSKKWTLKCQFSFDFYTPKIGSTSIGTGLSQFLMSNALRGTVVNVMVTLSECDEGVDVARGTATVGRKQRSGASGGNYDQRGRRASDGGSINPPPTCALPPCQEEDMIGGGLLSCFTHPLLMPLCGVSGGVETDKKKRKNKDDLDNICSTMNLCAMEEPSRVGASLLSAIKVCWFMQMIPFTGSRTLP